MSRRTIAYIIMALVLAVLVTQAFRPTTVRESPEVRFVVPDGYTGWLVAAWDCPGGESLNDLATGDDEYEITYAADGTACIADAHPSPGYVLDGYRYPGSEDADAITGGTLTPLDDENGTPVPDRLGLMLTTGQTYNFASIGIADDAFLGDGCDFNSFLADRFGEPIIERPCAPIPIPERDEG